MPALLPAATSELMSGASTSQANPRPSAGQVIIAAVNEGIVPLVEAVNNTDDPLVRKESENRERALLYVAATRAKRQVVVCSFGSASVFAVM